MTRKGASRGMMCWARLRLPIMLESLVIGISPGALQLGRPAAANHRLAAAELLDGDRPIGMLNEVGDEGGGAFGDIHVERIGGCRQVKAELRRQRLAAIAGGKHHLARLHGAFGGGDAEPGSFPCEREHRLLSEAQGTPGAGPAPNGRVGEEGIDLALMRAELRPDHRRAEIGRDPIELGAVEDRDIEPERRFRASPSAPGNRAGAGPRRSSGRR